ELGYGGKFIGPNLLLRSIDFGFSIRLPELIDPSETVVGDKNVAWEILKKVFEPGAGLGRQRDFKDGIALAEDLREHPHRETARERKPVFAARAGKLLALGQRNRDVIIRLDQQIVFRKETREEHP